MVSFNYIRIFQGGDSTSWFKNAMSGTGEEAGLFHIDNSAFQNYDCYIMDIQLDQLMEVLKWIGIAFIAGLIGYFGRYLGMLIIARLHKRKPELSDAAEVKKEMPVSEAEEPDEKKLKLEKKRLKLEKKKAKKVE